jgi:rSAM/selenodomain-associated transferase 1
MTKKNTLLVMARPPEKGKVKTRLAAAIGEEKTLLIYEVLLQKVRDITNHVDATIELFWTNLPYPTDFASLSNHIQIEGDLGNKMQSAFAKISASSHMVMIGTDCYDLGADRIQSAFDALDHADVVLGPAMDGGYYLIGMNCIHATLFEDMPWSTPELLETTIIRMRSEHLAFILLPTLRDIDEVADVLATDDLRPYLI